MGVLDITYTLPLQACTTVFFWWKVRNQTAVETTKDAWYEAYVFKVWCLSSNSIQERYASNECILCVCVDEYLWLSGVMIYLPSQYAFFHIQSEAFFQHLLNHQYDFVPICHNWSDNRSFHCCPGDKWVLQRKGSVHLTFTWWCSWIVIPFVVRDIVLRGLSGSHSINFHLAISSPCEWQVRASSIVRTNGNLDFQGLGYFLPGLGTLVSVWKKLYLCKKICAK